MATFASLSLVFTWCLLHSCKYYSSGFHQADSGNCPQVISVLLTVWYSILCSVWRPLQVISRQLSDYLPTDTLVPTHVLPLSGLSMNPEITSVHYSCGLFSHFKFVCTHLSLPDDLSLSSLCIDLPPRQMSCYSSTLPPPKAHSGLMLIL